MHRPSGPLRAAAALLLAGALGGCGGSDSVLELQVGDCLDQADLQGEQVTSVTPLDCAEPHDAEVYSEVRLTDGDYPGTDQVRARVEQQCTEDFAEFIGLPYEDSELYFSFLAPSEHSWTESDDRTGLCLVLSEEQITGSLEGARR